MSVIHPLVKGQLVLALIFQYTSIFRLDILVLIDIVAGLGHPQRSETMNVVPKPEGLLVMEILELEDKWVRVLITMD
jgi:hypothetical protein